MAISLEDCLLLCKGDRSYVLVKGVEYYLFVPMDSSFSDRSFRQLLQRYPCPLRELNRLDLHLSPFKTSSLRGVVLKGYEQGDGLDLWIGGDVRHYSLGQAYEDECLSSFFAPCLIVRQAPLMQEKPKKDLAKKLPISLTLCALFLSLVFAVFPKPYWLWSSLCIAVQLIGIVLPLLFPLEFTFHDIKPGSHTLGRGNLIFVPIIPAVSLTLRTLQDFHSSNAVLLRLLCISCGIAFPITLLIFYRLSMHLSRNRISAIFFFLGIWLSISFLGIGTVGQLSALFAVI